MSTEVENMADALPLTDDLVLSLVRVGIKNAYTAEESVANGGAMVYLDAEAGAIWDEAIAIAFDRWLAAHDAEIRAERDSLARLHEVATERTVQLAAVIEKVRALVMNTDGDYLDGEDFNGLAGEIQAVVCTAAIREGATNDD